MKKQRFGPQPFLYPMPTVIVGALVNGKPNFNTIAYVGIAQSRPPMICVSMDKGRFTHQGITQTGTFSVNIPSDRMVGITDFIGIYSGRNKDKTSLFSVFYGELKTAPMIEECPVNLECEVIETMDFGGKNDLFVGKIVESYAEKKYCTEGYPDIQKIRPFVFTRQDHNYWKVGEHLAEALSVGRSYRSEE
jgi:flavin reductase (DIM6/NTAB) family NADH-FMN oxidoreductase RutF